MVKKRRNIDQDQKENFVYNLLYFFISVFLIKVVLGIMTDSKSLLVSGIFVLFGIFISIVTIIRINTSGSLDSQSKRPNFCYDKLVFFIIAGISFIIAIATNGLLFSIIHGVLYHSLFPPDLLAVWVAAVAACANIYVLLFVKRSEGLLESSDIDRITFILSTDFILSVLVMGTVLLSRVGFFVADYIFASLQAIYIFIYSVYLLRHSFKGLMDSTCDFATLSKISKCIKNADPVLRIKDLKVSRVGNVLEIMATIYLSNETKMKEVKNVFVKIKQGLKQNISDPCQMYLGFSLGQKK